MEVTPNPTPVWVTLIGYPTINLSKSTVVSKETSNLSANEFPLVPTVVQIPVTIPANPSTNLIPLISSF